VLRITSITSSKRADVYVLNFELIYGCRSK